MGSVSQAGELGTPANELVTSLAWSCASSCDVRVVALNGVKGWWLLEMEAGWPERLQG